MDIDKLKIVDNILIFPTLVGSARLKPKLPMNQLWKELEKDNIFPSDNEKKDIFKSLLNSKAKIIYHKLSAGYMRYQREVGITVTEENRKEALKIIASPTGSIQCLVLK